MATRFMGRAAVLLLALGFSAGFCVGCGGVHAHRGRGLADKSAADKSGRVRIARDELRRIGELSRTIKALEREIASLVAAVALAPDVALAQAYQCRAPRGPIINS